MDYKISKETAYLIDSLREIDRVRLNVVASMENFYGISSPEVNDKSQRALSICGMLEEEILKLISDSIKEHFDTDTRSNVV